MSESELIVFGGPSLEGLEFLTKDIDIRPPIRRGDLDAIRRNGQTGWVLIIDGLFGANMSVTATECRLLIEDGWSLFGAASIGAIRAAELYSVGMQGLGTIYDLLRVGLIVDDAELAVAYNPATYHELTISLVHLRAILAKGYEQNFEKLSLDQLLEHARGIFFLDRSIAALRNVWTDANINEFIIEYVCEGLRNPTLHPKRKDAEYALRILTGTAWR